MRDRSRMSPEAAVFRDDDRTLEQRYEDCRAERDALEIQVRELAELIVDVTYGRIKPERLMMRMYLQNRGIKPVRTFGDPLDQQQWPKRSSVIYYVEMDGRVKIGVTASFAQRMQAFYVQPNQVLAVEPGDRTLESARHVQFAATRLERSELFMHSLDLDDHIADLRRRLPDPWTAGHSIAGIGV